VRQNGVEALAERLRLIRVADTSMRCWPYRCRPELHHLTRCQGGKTWAVQKQPLVEAVDDVRQVIGRPPLSETVQKQRRQFGQGMLSIAQQEQRRQADVKTDGFREALRIIGNDDLGSFVGKKLERTETWKFSHRMKRHTDGFRMARGRPVCQCNTCARRVNTL
jgi:hypothetical protein